MAAIIIHVFLLIIALTTVKPNLLPFTSIKLISDEIYITTRNDRSDWMKLKSISNITSEQMIKFSKQHYKETNCQIECYRFHLIYDLPTIYNSLSKKELSLKEYVVTEDDTKKNKLYELTSTKEKFEINLKFLNENLIFSDNKLKIFPEYKNMIFKSIGRNSHPFMNIFKGDDQFNIKTELNQIEKNIKLITIEEEKFKKNLSSNLNAIKTEINSERSLIKELYKVELITGIIGVIMISSLFVFYYVFKGLVNENLSPYKK